MKTRYDVITCKISEEKLPHVAPAVDAHACYSIAYDVRHVRNTTACQHEQSQAAEGGGGGRGPTYVITLRIDSVCGKINE